MELRFGKFKGKRLEDTPTWYREWLLKQDWFKQDWELTQATKSLYNDLVGNNKVHALDGLVYLSDGMYMTSDGDIVEDYL